MAGRYGQPTRLGMAIADLTGLPPELTIAPEPMPESAPSKPPESTSNGEADDVFTLADFAAVLAIADGLSDEDEDDFDLLAATPVTAPRPEKPNRRSHIVS